MLSKAVIRPSGACVEAMANAGTFFGARGAPNPRRVEIFMAEHGLFEGRGYEFVNVDMGKGEHKRNGKYPTPNQKLPMFVLPDGTQIGESVAICRYIEEAAVGPDVSKRLFGTDPVERAIVEMWQRRVELELLSGAVGKAWIHGPELKSLREFRGIEGHDSELQLGLGGAQALHREFDRELATRPYLAGDTFSIADITLLCVVDFVSTRTAPLSLFDAMQNSVTESCLGCTTSLQGAGPVHGPTRWTELPHLTAWHRRCSARTSVLAHPNPHIKPLGGNDVVAAQERYYQREYRDNGVWRPRDSSSKL